MGPRASDETERRGRAGHRSVVGRDRRPLPRSDGRSRIHPIEAAGPAAGDPGGVSGGHAPRRRGLRGGPPGTRRRRQSARPEHERSRGDLAAGLRGRSPGALVQRADHRGRPRAGRGTDGTRGRVGGPGRARARVLPARVLVRPPRLPGRRRGRQRSGLRPPPASAPRDRPASRAVAARQGAARPGGRAAHAAHAGRACARSPATDPAYEGTAGEQGLRATALDRGAAWPCLAALYFDALIRVHGESAKAEAWRWVDGFAPRLGGGTLATVPAAFEGDEPHRPLGEMASARAVAEVLRLVTRLGRRPSGRSVRPDPRV